MQRNKGNRETGNETVESKGQKQEIKKWECSLLCNRSWTSRHALCTEESDTAFRMKTLNSVSLQLHGVSGEWQVHHNATPLSRARYKTGGPAASDMDRSMLRQAGRRRTSQRARRSAFTVTWTSTPDPVDTAGVGMADTAPRVQSSSGLCANYWKRRNLLHMVPLKGVRSSGTWRGAVPQTGADVSEELDASEALVTIYWAALRHVAESRNLDTASGTSNPTPRRTSFPENSTSAQWLKKFAAFSESGRFITVITTNPTMSQLHPVCTLTQYFSRITFNIRLPIHFCPDLPSDLFTWCLFTH